MSTDPMAESAQQLIADASAPQQAVPDVKRARLGVSLIFAAHGAVYGSFATRIPWLQDHRHIGPGLLGVALLAPSVGALLGMPFASRLIHRYGGRRATRAMIVSWCICGALPMLAPDVPVLFLLLMLYGLTSGMADVAMNAQAIPVEHAAGKSIMSGLHGMWSVGGLVASGAGALAAHVNLDARIQLAIVAAVLVVIALIGSAFLPENVASADEEAPPHFVRPPRAVVIIGLIAFCALFAEASTSDWCAVYLKKVLGTSAGTAATAYTAFAFTMAASRLSGDFAVRRFGPKKTVRIAGIIGTAGGFLVVFANNPGVAIGGFALIGLGVAAVFPLAFAAAGHADAQPARAIAGVATIAYGAGIAAPGIVGGIAAASSLHVSFAIITALVAMLAIGAGVLQPKRPATEATVG
ncbi:MAG: MFS transporter [Acidothermaceae bacterium]